MSRPRNFSPTADKMYMTFATGNQAINPFGSQKTYTITIGDDPRLGPFKVSSTDHNFCSAGLAPRDYADHILPRLKDCFRSSGPPYLNQPKGRFGIIAYDSCNKQYEFNNPKHQIWSDVMERTYWKNEFISGTVDEYGNPH